MVDGDQKFWAIIWGIVGLTAIGIAWAISWAYVASWNSLTINGYVEQPVPTYSGTMWVKRPADVPGQPR